MFWYRMYFWILVHSKDWYTFNFLILKKKSKFFEIVDNTKTIRYRMNKKSVQWILLIDMVTQAWNEKNEKFLVIQITIVLNKDVVGVKLSLGSFFCKLVVQTNSFKLIFDTRVCVFEMNTNFVAWMCFYDRSTNHHFSLFNIII